MVCQNSEPGIYSDYTGSHVLYLTPKGYFKDVIFFEMAGMVQKIETYGEWETESNEAVTLKELNPEVFFFSRKDTSLKKNELLVFTIKNGVGFVEKYLIQENYINLFPPDTSETFYKALIYKKSFQGLTLWQNIKRTENLYIKLPVSYSNADKTLTYKVFEIPSNQDYNSILITSNFEKFVQNDLSQGCKAEKVYSVVNLNKFSHQQKSTKDVISFLSQLDSAFTDYYNPKKTGELQVNRYENANFYFRTDTTETDFEKRNTQVEITDKIIWNYDRIFPKIMETRIESFPTYEFTYKDVSKELIYEMLNHMVRKDSYETNFHQQESEVKKSSLNKAVFYAHFTESETSGEVPVFSLKISIIGLSKIKVEFIKIEGSLNEFSLVVNSLKEYLDKNLCK